MYRIGVPLLLSIVMLFCLSRIGCGSRQNDIAVSEQYPVNRSDTVSVELKGISDAQVVIFDSEPARIIASYSHFIENLQNFIDQYNVSDDIILLEKVRAMASETDSVNIADIAEEARLIERFQYRLADMLQKGEAMVFQKKTGEAARNILVEHFEFIAHKMAGRGGRRFYLPDRTLFLEIIDWIS